MHKSRGNAIAPMPVLDSYGADATRFFMLHASPVWTPLKFDEDGIKEMISKFFNTLKNTYNFFALYANTDNIDIKECNVSYENREYIDKWLISKYNRLVKNVTNSYEEYDLNKVTKYLTEFVSEDLSNWYIRRNRKRFWGSELDDSKKAVYMTTYEILVGVTKLLAPICPFVTEEIYTKLTGEESVHLADFPTYEESLINDEIEKKMDLVRDLISIGRFVREETKIKVRQPISECLIAGKNEELISDLTSLIIEELNVKEVKFVSDVTTYMNMSVKPNFKVCGAMFGKNMKEYQTLLENLSQEEIASLNSKENIEKEFLGENITITPEMVDIRISHKEGFDVGMENNEFVTLNTELNKELIEEGIAREFISKIQNLRKTKDFNIIDRINITYSSDEEVKEAITNFEEYISKEVLALSIEFKDNNGEVIDINDHEVTVTVEVSK